MFRIPQKNNALETWSRAVGQPLASKDRVCALHFSDASIITETTRVLTDGTVYRMPYARKRLVPNAIPETITSDTDNDCNGNVRDARDTSPIEIDPIEFGNESSTVYIEAGNDCNGNVRDARDTSPIEIDPIEFGNESSTVYIEADNDCNGDVRDARDTSPIEIDPIEFGNESSTVYIEADNDCNGDVRDARDTSPIEIDPIEFGNESSTVYIEAYFNDPVASETENAGESVQFVIEDVTKNMKKKLPKNWWWTANNKAERSLVFILMNPHTCTAALRLVLYNDLSVTIFTADEKVSHEMNSTIASIESLELLIHEIGNKEVCSGSGMEKESRDHRCPIFVAPKKKMRFTKTPRCQFCRALRKKLQNLSNRRKCNLRTRYERSRRVVKLHQRSCNRLRKKVKSLRKDIADAYQKCAAAKQQALDDALSEFPDVQKEAFSACINAAKVNRINQRRYTSNWVYECLLMRIKSSKLYDHLRKKNILPLPCKDTLNRYIQKLDTSCGFQKPVFECLRLKSSSMNPVDRRGTILVDEIALSEAINLDRKTMKFNGFVDLGKHTPDELQDARADHALVFMFQPFRGLWIQVLGCFLSRRSVTSAILHKLLIECLIRIEEAGFYVDAITMDGAQWNRGVWTLLGVNPDQVSCEHPCDSDRRLWMISDFPHLAKTFRGGILKAEEFETPDGTVKIDHFRALLDYEGFAKPNMSIAYKLTPTHLAPKGYQTMNVPLAFELFSHQVGVAMEVLRNDPRCIRLKHSSPTIDLIKRVGNLIDAMMSRKSFDALRPDDTCKRKKAIEDFLTFLKKWQTIAKEKRVKFPIPAPTFAGLRVTLRSTLELMKFLHEKHEFQYLMTARLTQDALERFFGMMRNACGSNEHPDPVLFTQVFRLLCTYSLVKPPKGCNVSGPELLETLMSTKESLDAQEKPKIDLFNQLDAAIDRGHFVQPPSMTAEHDHLYLETQSVSNCSHLSQHDYDVVTTSPKVLSYVAGYTARRIKSVTRCRECIDRLTSRDSCERDQVIDTMNRYDGLTYPSEELFKLIQTLEDIFLGVVGTLTVKQNTLHQIVKRVSEIENLTLVGCREHEQKVTKKIVTFFLVMRAHFLAKSVNRNFNEKKVKSKVHRKISKL